MIRKNNKLNFKLLLTSMLLVAFLVVLFSPVAVVIAGENSTTNEKSLFEGVNKDCPDDDIHLATRLTSSSDDAPSLTVLVHGQSGSASHWSNDSEFKEANDDSDFKFVSDPNSLIESLRYIAPNADVFRAKMNDDAQNNFYLMRLNRENYDETKAEYITKLNDASKHIIVVFESAKSRSYHRDVYDELHRVIDRISYDILYLTGKIPTVNLISHSRGGLISMMYAAGYREDGKLNRVIYTTEVNGGKDIGDGFYEIPVKYNSESSIIEDHPFNVSGLYSMGTPYCGTDWDKEILGGISHDILGGSFANESAKNILDETIQAEIHSCWEEAVEKNPSLKLNAIGGTFNLTFIIGLLSEDSEYLKEYIRPEFLSMGLNILDEWGVMAAVILKTIDVGLTYGAGKVIAVPYIGKILAIPVGALKISVKVADAAVINAVKSLNEFKIKYAQQLQDEENIEQLLFTELSYVLKDFVDAFNMVGLFVGQFNGNANLVHDWGDLFIDTKSQFAEGFSNVETFEKLFAYSDIDYMIDENNKCVITYQYRTFDYKKTAKNAAIPHNLETRDSTIISYICDNIELGVPATIYDYEILSDNTVKITDVNLPSYYFDNNGNVVAGLKELKLGLEAGVAGRQVSYIDNKAFANFSNLKAIVLPDSITSIGNRAFENCVGLTETFSLPKNLRYLGEAVFYNCTNISKFNIDTSNPYYYIEDDALYAKKSYCSNSGIIYDVISDSYGKTLVAYPAARTETDYSVPLDVVNIANYAMSKNIKISSISLNNVSNIGVGAFQGCSKLSTINGGSRVSFVGENAFKSTSWLSKNSSINKVIGKVLVKYNGNESIFSSDNYTSISANAFNGNNCIQAVIIGCNTKHIGAKAFANCEKLTSVTFLQLTGITQTEKDVLANHCDNIEIFVPNSKKSQYTSFVNFSKYASYVKPIVVDVNFDTKGGTTIAPMKVYYGDIVTLPTPVKKGYDFTEWKKGNSVISYDDAWDIYDSEVTVEAQWTPASYVINFNKQGGTDGDSTAVVYYLQPMPNGLSAPVRTGYKFAGYFSGKNGSGTQYYDSSMASLVPSYKLTTATTLYAYWTSNRYKLVFDTQGGTNGTTSAVALYGQSMPQATAPSKSGYKFAGYFTGKNGTGKQYYSSTMDSSRNYDVTAARTLYAYWIVEKFEITISSQQSQWVEISSNQLGLKNTQVSIEYGATANQTINKALINAYQLCNGVRTGYDLLGFYKDGDSSQTLINWGNKIPDLGEDGAKIVLKPKWSPKKYNLKLNYQSGKVGSFGTKNSISVSSYSSSDYAYIYFVPSSSGTITLRTSHTVGDPYLYLYNANMVQLAANDDGYGNRDAKITYNVVSGVKYYIGFRAFGSKPTSGAVYYSGVSMSTSTAAVSYSILYDSKLPSVTKPFRSGYTFDGYYTQSGGKGEKVYNKNGKTSNVWGFDENITLYAKWLPNSYSVTFNKQGGTGGTSSVSVVYGQKMTFAEPPTRVGYNFIGYYTEPNGAGTRYYNSSMESVRSYNKDFDITLYAYWKPVTYIVKLNKSGGTTAQTTFSSTMVSYNKEDIRYIYFVPKESGTITLWTTHTQGDPYLYLYNENFVQLTCNDNGAGNRDSKISYNVSSNKSYYVGFRAYSGNKTTGKVEFSGVSVYSSATSVKITYNTTPASVLVPQKTGYEFDGYYTSTNGNGTKIYDSKGQKLRNWNITNTTLYANWEFTPYSYEGSTVDTITGKTSIVNLPSDAPKGTYVFKISRSVSEVTFKSSTKCSFSNFRIDVETRTSPLIVRFDNVSITAPENCNAITAKGIFPLTIAYNGTVTITGGRNSTIGTGQGYDAVRNSTSGGTVILKGTGTLKLVGGIGSTGKQGTTGKKGADGEDAGIFIADGGNGSKGGDGGTGGTGGKGGYAIYATKITVESTSGSITLIGGKGGTGGQGGTGGEGGRGGHAIGSLFVSMNGGDGGTGGTGGIGGSGGAGGAALNSSCQKKYTSCVTATISNGVQGNGGRGGDGGNGGYGGSNGPSAIKEGEHGNGGSGGAGGKGGNGSVGGDAGYTGYTGGYYYAV